MAALAAGAVPAKFKDLIALGVALTIQCPYFIEIDGPRARAGGASEAEIAETVLIAAALRAGVARFGKGMHHLREAVAVRS
jgi:AhpD family alkylhydroperoxidase